MIDWIRKMFFYKSFGIRSCCSFQNGFHISYFKRWENAIEIVVFMMSIRAGSISKHLDNGDDGIESSSQVLGTGSLGLL